VTGFKGYDVTDVAKKEFQEAMAYQVMTNAT